MSVDLICGKLVLREGMKFRVPCGLPPRHKGKCRENPPKRFRPKKAR